MEAFKKYPFLSLGIFALVTLVFAYWFGSRTGKADEAGEDEDQINKEIQHNDLNYEPTQYTNYADTIHQALLNFFDNEKAVYNVFAKMRTRSDLLELIKAFGSRSNWVWNVGSGTLGNWLTLKLDSSEISEINEILTRNNIDFHF